MANDRTASSGTTWRQSRDLAGKVTKATHSFSYAPWTPDSEATKSLLVAIVASCDDAIMTKDTDDRITSWNPGAERLYGYRAAEIIGQPSMRLVPPERSHELYRILNRLRNGERVDHFETVRLRKDGSRVEVSVSVSPLRDVAGRLIGASAIARDVTARKHAEHGLAARERQQTAMETLRRRAATSVDVSTLMDEAVALVVRTLNAASCAILEPLSDGATLRVRAGGGWAERLVGQVTARSDSLAGYTLASGEPVVVGDLATDQRFRRRTALDQTGVISAMSVVMGGQERPAGVLQAFTAQRRVFTADDIHFLRGVANLLATVSMRTAAEEALRVSERRYRAIFEQSPSGLILYAPDGRLLDANQAVRGALPLGQVRSYNVLADQRLAAAGVMDDIRQAFAGQAVRLPPLPVPLPREAGALEETARWVRPFLYPVKDEAGAVRDIVAMVEDITEQVQAYRLLEQRVAERTHELSTLLKVSNDVASTLELQPLLDLILDHLRSVVDYASAMILIPEGEHLVVLDYRGPLARERVARLRFPLMHAVDYQESLRCGGPFIIDDLSGDAPLAQAMREGPAAELYATFAYSRSHMAVPLMVKDRIIGLVTFDHTTPNTYTPQHAALAQTIANQAAVAIENARLYAQAQEMAASEERARLARELHDSVTQMLFSSSIIADVLPRLWERDEDDGRRRLDDLRLLTRGALAEMRTLLLELRPAALQEADLDDLLRRLAEAMTGRTRVPVTVTVEGRRAVPPDVQIALYRVVQESLNNIAKHAEASAVDVSLHRGPEGVDLHVTDDGCGFDPTMVAAERFGLSIMRERAESIGATLSIESAPGRGTRVLVRWRGTYSVEGL